jgi:hypothetical protein
MSNNINNINLIFSENPIARAYLYLFTKEKMINNEIIYLNHKTIFNKFFLKLQFNNNFKNTKKYLKNPDVLILIKEIEKFFDLEENFLINMYCYENIFKFKNLIYAKGPNINSNENINFFNKLNNEHFLNTSNIIYKNIFNSNKKFYHIHPGYIYKVRGCDGALNSINNYNSLGASFFLMNKKIDSGDILKRYEQNYHKLTLPNFKKYNVNDLYNIWFSFFDPALRVSFLKKLLNENVSLNKFQKIDFNKEENNYFKFIDKTKLYKIFLDKIFKD